MGQGNGTGGWKRTRCDRPEKRKLGHPVAPFPPGAPRHLNPSRSTWSRRDQVRRQRRRVRACVSPASALLALGLSLAPRYVPLLWCCLSLPSPPASWLPVAACSCSLSLSLLTGGLWSVMKVLPHCLEKQLNCSGNPRDSVQLFPQQKAVRPQRRRRRGGWGGVVWRAGWGVGGRLGGPRIAYMRRPCRRGSR